MVELGLDCCARSCSAGVHWFDCCVNQTPAKADSGALVVSGQGQGFGREVPKPTASNGLGSCVCCADFMSPCFVCVVKVFVLFVV